jgi:hypothetical protein
MHYIAVLPEGAPFPDSVSDRVECTATVGSIQIRDAGRLVLCFYELDVPPCDSTELRDEVCRVSVVSAPFESRPRTVRFAVTAEIQEKAATHTVVNFKWRSLDPIVSRAEFSMAAEVEGKGPAHTHPWSVDRSLKEPIANGEISQVFVAGADGKVVVTMSAPPGSPEMPIVVEQPTLTITDKATLDLSAIKLWIDGQSTTYGPTQPIKVRWELSEGGGSFGENDMIVCLPQGVADLHETKSALHNMSKLPGEGELPAPHQPGNYDVRIWHISPAGMQSFVGKCPIVVAIKRNTPIKLAVPARVKPGVPIPVEWALGSDVMPMHADFIGLYRRGDSMPQAMERIAVPSGSIKLNAPHVSGEVEIRYMALCVGDTSLTATKTVEFVIAVEDVAPPAPAAAPPASALPTSWAEFFTACGLPDDVCADYAGLFEESAIGLDQIPDLSNEILKDLEIKPGHRMKIMKLVTTTYKR